MKAYSFPDHHNYSKRDFDKIIEENPDLGPIKVVTTEKDYFRMNEKQKQNCDYIKVDLEIENKDQFINLIKSKL